ncbi:MAG: ATP-binding protein [bacterium]|nr:ATP-binding protein [bacterium]
MDDTESSRAQLLDDTLAQRDGLMRPYDPDELRSAQVFDQLEEAWWVLDGRGALIDMNAAAARLLGAPHDALINTLFMDRLDEADALALRETCSRAYQTRQGENGLLLRVRRDDGELRRIEASLSLLTRADGSVIGFGLFARDITRIAAENEERDARLADLEALELIRAQFIRVITHDLRNPLTLAIGYVDFLAETIQYQMNDDQRAYLDQIRRAHRRIQEISADGSTLAQTYASKRPPANRVLLDLLVRKAMIDFRPLTSESDKRLTFESVLPAHEVVVMGEESVLYRAIANLVSNAIKFTPPNGRITLRLVAHDDHAAFSVEDTGYGIPLEHHGRLFTAFTRIATPGAPPAAGTGMGLYIVKRIVEWHQGRVWFTSTPGAGSTFGFDIPISAAPG